MAAVDSPVVGPSPAPTPSPTASPPATTAIPVVTTAATTTATDTHSPNTLVDLSRNASAISTDSSDSSSAANADADAITFLTPRLNRPLRTFTAPRSLSPHSPSPRSPPKLPYLSSDHPPPPPPPAAATGATYTPTSTSIAYAVDDLRRATPNGKPRSKSRGRPSMSSTEDFRFGTSLGEGSYSTVQRATHILTGQQYAIKILEKSHLARNNKMHTAIAERKALAALGASHPGIVRLHSAFQDDWRLYFVLDLARNGEMKTLLNKLGSLSLQCSRYYAAQLVDTIEYMHSKGVIHRDLKPENLLLDDNNRMKICDFGTGKTLETGVDRAQTWVGTAQYIAPELLEARETSKSSDFWALGCIIYQFIAGRFAFQGLSDFLTWQKIKKLEYSFPEGFDEEAKDLIQKLLVREPTERLGVGSLGMPNDIQALKSHPFFKSIDWDKLWSDPAPPLEAGLFKKEHPLPPGNDQIWDDVEAAWDGIMAEDEVGWASDVDEQDDGTAEYLLRHRSANGVAIVGKQGDGQGLGKNDTLLQQDLETPVSSLPPQPLLASNHPTLSSQPNVTNVANGLVVPAEPTFSGLQDRRGTGSTIQGVEDIKRQLAKEQTTKEQSSSALEDSPTTSSSSSENSPDTKIITIPPTPPSPKSGTGSGGPPSQTPTRTATTSSTAVATNIMAAVPSSQPTEEDERGRNPALSPKQGHGLSSDVDFAKLLKFPAEEVVLFNSIVEECSMRRRASKLIIPLPVPHSTKVKTRQLVLTNRRLLCLKQREHPMQPPPRHHYHQRQLYQQQQQRQKQMEVSVSIKFEVALKASERTKAMKEKEKEKEAKGVVASVQRKSEKEFVVLTTTKSYNFAVQTPELAQIWLSKLDEALAFHGRKLSQTRT